MPEIFLNNVELIDKLRELYSNASPSKIRDLIASHFIPSEEEKKKNAEVSTPKKVFEPCCSILD